MAPLMSLPGPFFVAGVSYERRAFQQRDGTNQRRLYGLFCGRAEAGQTTAVESIPRRMAAWMGDGEQEDAASSWQPGSQEDAKPCEVRRQTLAGFSAYLDQIEAKSAKSKQHLEQVKERHP